VTPLELSSPNVPSKRRSRVLPFCRLVFFGLLLRKLAGHLIKCCSNVDFISSTGQPAQFIADGMI